MHRSILRFAVIMAVSAPIAAAPEEMLVAVRPGDRLDISNYAGEIRIDTWERDTIRVLAERRKGDKILVTRSGSVIRVRSDSSVHGKVHIRRLVHCHSVLYGSSVL